MENTRTLRHQTALITLLFLTAAVAMVLVLRNSEQSFMSTDGIPLPFGGRNSTLPGSITTIGTKGIYPVTDVSFDNGETSEVLPTNTINFILTPDSPTISGGAPLSAALPFGKRIFGYKYTSRSAATERANINAVTFAEKFPGQFFVSAEQRSFDSYIGQFETDHGVTFLPLSLVTLDKNARYIVIANDAGTSVTPRGLAWCGDGRKSETEACDGTDLSVQTCQTLGFDGGTLSCSSSCAVVTSLCTTAPVCGNGVVEASEQCDDGNNIDNDSCDNTCHFVAAPF